MAFLQKDSADDLLFPMDESGQGRFNQMRVLMLSGAGAGMRMAEFIRSYTNRDGSTGLPSIHIGATSPYIDGGNLFYIFFQDNANDPHVESNFPATDRNGDAITYEVAEATRAAAITANEQLIARLNGSDRGWKV